MTISCVSCCCGVFIASLLASAGLAGAVARAGGWGGPCGLQAGPANVLFGENQLAVLGDAQAIVLAFVADQDFLAALK
ncbi:hypothetical protein SDC9_165702 [bioreactor metagenome]|uniref:Uncharacterized protein n=1 Tax=bioreactor metagenome TaxID=1076179 RepID=A0A645FXB2_9ZZZZ